MSTFDVIVTIPIKVKEFKDVTWADDEPPDIICLADGMLLIKLDRAARADAYLYRTATAANLRAGKLHLRPTVMSPDAPDGSEPPPAY